MSLDYLVAGVVQRVHLRLDVLQIGSRGFSLEDYFVHRNYNRVMIRAGESDLPPPSPLLFDSLEDGGVKSVKGGRGTERLLNKYN